jgi:hypothetical protein
VATRSATERTIAAVPTVYIFDANFSRTDEVLSLQTLGGKSLRIKKA